MVIALQSAAPPLLDRERPRIAILLGAPLNAQNFERVGIPYLSPYADIIVFDCKPWLGRSDVGLHHEAASWSDVVVIDSASALERMLHHYQPDYALDYIGLGPLTPCLQRLLAASGTRFVVQKSGSLPQPSLWARFIWKFKVRRKARSTAATIAGDQSQPASGLLVRGRQRILLAWGLRRALLAPDVALLAGSASLDYFTRKAQKILWVGSQDYHIYRKRLEMAPDGLPAGSYAVFVDDNLPYASDWSLLGLSAPVTPDRYYAAMRQLLSKLESHWGMPVVIAAHPSARHDERVINGFGGRSLIHGRSAELVRGAQAVLLHGSTAVSFAILGDKPLLFLSSDELQLSSYGLHIRTMASQLGLVPFNIDREASLPCLDALTPKQHLYAQYADRYLCRTGNSEIHPWQAFISYIENATPAIKRHDCQTVLGLYGKYPNNS